MSFESDVNDAVKEGLNGHLRYYVEDYLKWDSEKDRADYRGYLIAEENSFFDRNSYDGARLRVIEYLDSHPHEKQQAIDYMASLRRSESMPGISASNPHGEAAAILQEQLHRLEGGFLVALVQGIYNEIYHDPAVALDKAGIAVTVAGIAETAAEGKVGGIESAKRFEEDQVQRQEFVDEVGKKEINRTVSEIGGKSAADNWPNTAQELGRQSVKELESTRGQAATGDLIRDLHPGGVPGESAWQEGNIRHPEQFSPEAEKREGTPDTRAADHSNAQQRERNAPVADRANAAPPSNVQASQQSNPDRIFHPTAGVHTQVESVSGADGHRQYVYGEGGFSGQTASEHAANAHEGAAWQSRNAGEIICAPGTPVYAAFNGVIGANFGLLKGHEKDGPDSKYHGNRLSIEGPSNSAYYAHLDHFARGIAPGTKVHAGQLLGYSGVGGGVAHLHIAFQRGDTDRMLHDAAGRNDVSRSLPEQGRPTPTRSFGEKER